MADKQHPYHARPPAMLGDEVAGAADGIGHRHPLRREPQGVERCAEHRTHLAHALEIQRAAGDVDDLLQVGDLRFARGGNARPHSLLRAVEARRLENEKDVGRK